MKMGKNTKIYRRQKNNSLNKALYLTIMVGVMVIVCSFQVFAFDFDNVVKYNENNKVISIINSFGLGSEIASAKLITPHINYVIHGKNRRVMVFNVENFGEEYANALKDLEIINMNNGKKVVRDYHWEYAVNYEVDVNDYKTICSPTGKIDLRNGTTETSCTSVISGTHKETRTRWENLTSTNLPKGSITIALVTDVLPGDYMDGIPTLFGKKIDRWAIWTDSMTNGLKHYFNMTGYSTTIYNQINLTANGIMSGNLSRTANGFIGDGLQNSNFSSPEINKMVSPGRLPPAPFTFSAWINPSEYNPNSEIAQSGSGSGEDRFYISLSNENQIVIPDILVSVPDIPLNNWTYLTIIYHGEGLYSIYHNGTFVSNKTGQNMSSDRDNSWNIRLSSSGQASGNCFVGKIDEVAYWNRSLSETEINNMYNGGEGMSYAPSYPPTLSILFPTSANYSSIITEINYSVSNATYPLDTCWYSLDNGLTNTTITCGENITGISSQEGSNTWTVYVNDTSGNSGSDSVTFVVDTLPPEINITYPTDTIIYHQFGNSIDLNWSISDSSLDSCWYEYNGVNTTVNCEDNTTTFTPTRNNQTLIMWANDSVGHYANSSTSWDYLVIDNGQIYNNQTIETSNEHFYINFTYDSSTYLSKVVNLIYNNTLAVVGTDLGSGDNAIYNVTYQIPSVSNQTTMPFYWNIILNDGSDVKVINTTVLNQTVSSISPITLTSGSCSAGYFPAMNFSFFDEGNRTKIKVDLNYNFKYGIGNLTSESIAGSFSNVSSFKLCINSSATNYGLGYGEIDYKAPSYLSLIHI